MSRPGYIMPPKSKLSPEAASIGADSAFLRTCREVAGLSRDDLLAAAIARGCAHYAPLWPDLRPVNMAWLPHEALGCALLRGEADAATFQAIRCGVMVLSDQGNDPELIGLAATQFGVAGRVAHLAGLAFAADSHALFWEQVGHRLPPASPGDREFLPGVSRLVSETRRSGPGAGAARGWLRTDYRR